MLNISEYWNAVLNQNPDRIRTFFHEKAYINWHNTNEHFNVDEFIKGNCEYLGNWGGKVERLETIGELIITVTHVWEKDQKLTFHVTSFMQIENEKILSIDEYWSEDGEVPEWRKNLNIGTTIS